LINGNVAKFFYFAFDLRLFCFQFTLRKNKASLAKTVKKSFSLLDFYFGLLLCLLFFTYTLSQKFVKRKVWKISILKKYETLLHERSRMPVAT